MNEDEDFAKLKRLQRALRLMSEYSRKRDVTTYDSMFRFKKQLTKFVSLVESMQMNDVSPHFQYLQNINTVISDTEFKDIEDFNSFSNDILRSAEHVRRKIGYTLNENK